MGNHQSTHRCSSQGVTNVSPLYHIRHKIIYIFHQKIYFPSDGDIFVVWNDLRLQTDTAACLSRYHFQVPFQYLWYIFAHH